MPAPTPSSFFGVTPTVYVIESVSPSDRLKGKCESDALCAALKLGGIPNERFAPTTKSDLVRDLETVAQFINNNRDARMLSAPNLHISAHGSGDGIELTDGTVVSWLDLRELLNQFASACHRVNQCGLALTELCVSSCWGASAKRMFEFGTPFPCVGLIGPRFQVDWDDALVAWVVYYHHLLKKQVPVARALERMNSALGAESFASYMPPEIETLFSPNGLALASAYDRSLAND